MSREINDQLLYRILLDKMPDPTGNLIGRHGFSRAVRDAGDAVCRDALPARPLLHQVHGAFNRFQPAQAAARLADADKNDCPIHAVSP
ncbi:hypothetical protein D3C77_736310 [compost metagenome]